MFSLILYIAFSFLLIFGINYFNVAAVDYTFTNVLIAFVSLAVLRVLYAIFARFMKVFLFAVVFLPLVGLFGYYVYSYVTGQPIEMIEWPL